MDSVTDDYLAQREMLAQHLAYDQECEVHGKDLAAHSRQPGYLQNVESEYLLLQVHCR